MRVGDQVYASIVPVGATAKRRPENHNGHPVFEIVALPAVPPRAGDRLTKENMPLVTQGTIVSNGRFVAVRRATHWDVAGAGEPYSDTDILDYGGCVVERIP